MKNANTHLTAFEFPNHFFMAPSKPSTSAELNACSLLKNKVFLKMDTTTTTTTTNNNNGNSNSKGKKTKIPSKRKSSAKILPIDQNGNPIYECPKCKEILKSLHDLTSHLRSHNGINNSRSDHECHQCQKILSSSSSLDRHMLTHSGEKPFSCNICTQSFTTNGNMHRHMRTHERKNEAKRINLNPKQKGKNSRAKGYVKNTDITNTSTTITNIIPSEKLNEFHPDLRPLWMGLNKKPKPNTLTPPTNLIVSSDQPTQDAPQDLSQKSNPSLIQPHHVIKEELQDPYDMSSMEITNEEFSSHKFPLMSAARVPPQKSFQHKYSCNQCSSTFPCEQALDSHYREHFPDQLTSCSTCEVTFNSTDEFKQHNIHYHQDRGKERQRAFMNSLNLAYCSGTRSVSPQSEISTTEFTSVNKRSNSEGQLPGLNSPKISFEEVSSPKDLSESSLLCEKNKSVCKDEPAVNEYQGKVCTNLTTPKKKSSYTCTYCNQIFPNTRSAKSHERGHLGLSPYQCKSCTYASPDKSTLIRHMRTHNGERPYQCKLCSYPFTTKANCERHVKKKHHISTKEELEMKVACMRENNEIPNGQDSFSSLDTVQEHVLSNFAMGRLSPNSLSLSPGSSPGNNNHSYMTTDLNVKPLDLRSSKNFPVSASPSSTNSVHHEEDGVGVSGVGVGGNVVVAGSGDGSGSGGDGSRGSGGGDEPIDLSVKKPKKSSRKASKSAKLNAQPHKCSLDFSQNVDPQWHMNQLHNNPASSAQQQEQAVIESSQELVIQESNQVSSPVRFDSDTSDLASVNEIINTADTNSFKEYMMNPSEDVLPDAVNGHEDIPSPVEYDSNLVKKIKEEPQDPEERDVYGTVMMEECNSSNPTDSKDTIPQETDESKQKSLKKKRNSYADSPHKLKCPYCPRNFPWASSLKRHILTHTGEKPYECHKCHVIFSTKSNRERHLTRKHGVNMLDPASRQSMDRPHKCHLCVFSSFATKDNLCRHYRERHPTIPMPDNVGFDPTEKVLNLSSLSTTDMLNDAINNNNNNSQVNNDSNNNNNNNNSNPRVNSYNETLHSTPKNNCVEESECNNINVSCIKHEMDNNNNDEENEGGDKLVIDESKDEMSLNNHWTPVPVEMSMSRMEESTTHICERCNKVFSTNFLLLEHLKEHEVYSPFKCYLCNASFDERAECLAHKEQHHNSQWQVLATKNNIDNIEYFCNKMDLSASDIDGNQRQADYLSKGIYCSFCVQRFHTLLELQNHMQSHNVNNFIEENQTNKSISATETKGHISMETTMYESPNEGLKSNILPEILGLKESDIEKMIENATSGGGDFTYIPSDNK
ncbi:ras-responsive element-binding protein 1 isoform X5 [Argonauta hians]